MSSKESTANPEQDLQNNILVAVMQYKELLEEPLGPEEKFKHRTTAAGRFLKSQKDILGGSDLYWANAFDAVFKE